jgi:UDP-glucose 4-epimerase
MRPLRDPIEAQFARRRVLVTGASGFLGTHLCQRLSLGGAELHAVSRFPRPSDNHGTRWWQANMEDPQTVQGLLGRIRPEVIFHLSGMVKAAPDLALVLPTLHSLLTATVNLLTAAARMGCQRVVLAGSLEEPEPGPADPIPSSPYSAAKWAASAYGRMFHRLYQSPVVILRTFMTYGPGQPVHKVIPATVLSLLQGQAPRLSSGWRKLDWVYVDDVIDGFLRAAHRPGLEGMTIDLGSGTALPIREVVTRIAHLIDPTVEPRYGALPDHPSSEVRVADIDATKAAIDWRPLTPLGKGLELTVNWFRTHHKTPMRDGAADITSTVTNA